MSSRPTGWGNKDGPFEEVVIELPTLSSFDSETLSRGLNFTLSTDVGDLDLLGEITGGGRYEDLLPHTIVLNLFVVACRCLGLKCLIEVKRVAGRPRDLEAVAELEALLEEKEKKA